jgi:hypothetical protein
MKKLIKVIRYGVAVGMLTGIAATICCLVVLILGVLRSMV